MFGTPFPTWLGWLAGPAVVVITILIVSIFYSNEKKRMKQKNK